MKKVILVLADGMRSDSLATCGNSYYEELEQHSYYTLNGSSVMPTVTLPCHLSLFHSIPPERHGTLTNAFTPPVRPVKGLCEVIDNADGNIAFFYSFNALRDLALPGVIEYDNFISGEAYGYEDANHILTDAAISFINERSPEFTFLYLGSPDEQGHRHGWMSEEYLKSIDDCQQCLKKVIDSVSDEYMFVFTADHGGHARGHGSDDPQDMTIPFFFYHKDFESKELDEVNLLDVAPTIAVRMGLTPNRDWEGTPIELPQ